MQKNEINVASQVISDWQNDLFEYFRTLRLTEQGYKPTGTVPGGGVVGVADAFDRPFFGSGSDQTFSFPCLSDLCRMAGIDLGQRQGNEKGK